MTQLYSYSLFNLDAMASLAWILSDESMYEWNYTLPDGSGMRIEDRRNEMESIPLGLKKTNY